MEDDVAVQAVANLASAVATSLMMDDPTGGRVKIFLTLFDTMNDQTIPGGDARDKLRASGDAIRAVLTEMGQ